MQYIAYGVGGSSFDDDEEIRQASKASFKRLDIDQDGLIEPEESQAGWGKVGVSSRLLTVDAVADWVTHAIQLPQHAEAFRRNAIMGSHLPWLLESDGAMLAEDVGIQSELHRRQLLRGIRMAVLGIGSVPRAPKWRQYSSEMNAIKLKWSPTLRTKGGIPAHKYELQQLNSGESVWRTVYADSELSFINREVRPGDLHTYRLRAWNSVGASDWSEEIQDT